MINFDLYDQKPSDDLTSIEKNVFAIRKYIGNQ